MAQSGSLPTKIFNVKSYGALGNGVADDQNAIQAAINAAAKSGGGIVSLPAGNYRHSGVLNVTSGVTIMGLGHQTVLQVATPSQGAIKFTSCSNCGVQNLWIAGEGSPRLSNGEATGIWLYNSTNCTISNVFVDGVASAGILVDKSSQILVTNNDIRNTMADGIHVTDGSNQVVVSNNIAYNTGDDSFAAVAYANDPLTSNVTFLDNTSTNSKARGVSCVGAWQCTITGNTVTNPAAHGIDVAYEASYNTYHPQNALVSQNTITGATASGMNGIVVDGGKSIALVHNQVSNSRSVFIDNSDTISLTDNELQTIEGPGVLAQASTNVLVSGTKIVGATAPGITFESVITGSISYSELFHVCLQGGSAAIFVDKSDHISGNANAYQADQNPGPVELLYAATSTNVTVSN